MSFLSIIRGLPAQPVQGFSSLFSKGAVFISETLNQTGRRRFSHTCKYCPGSTLEVAILISESLNEGFHCGLSDLRKCFHCPLPNLFAFIL